MKKNKKWPIVLLSLLLLFAILCGAGLGKALAVTKNTVNTENFTEFTTALPTRLFDINGELITEFASDEKREIISLNRLPQHMIDALLTREDRIFYDHHGYSVKAVFRAVVGILTHNSLGGGSTLTQQIAGTLYCDRREKSITRKLKELWWAIQMERRYTKNEILEIYLNKIYFGGGTYGVNAASKYYFGHGATQITPAESAMLVIQLSNPVYYNPFENTNRAQEMQQYIMNEMVQEGYISQDACDESFDDFWANFDYTRTTSSAYAMRHDEAPWFSEYVRRELSDMLYGTEDLYTGGYSVNTTLNLSYQRAAEEIMSDYIVYANKRYKSSLTQNKLDYFRRYIPVTELITLAFNLPGLQISEKRARTLTMSAYAKEANPVLDIMTMITGLDSVKTQIVNKGSALLKRAAEKDTVEGTMISVENETGYINAIVGGSQFDESNQFIRATQARIQPGSSFKPLYYSAAIDTRVITMTTVLSDTPAVFMKEDGTPYIPNNYGGTYRGNVEVWYALCQSLNIPALKVLDMTGFDSAIIRATDLLGIPENEWEERAIVPLYALGLGVCSVRPIEMAKAYATIANNGKEVTPIAIRYIEDRNGNILLNPERELRDKEKQNGGPKQIVSQQNAFIMQEMLKKTVESGTLSGGANFNSTKKTIQKDKGKGYKFRYTDENGKPYYMPVAGKTGTTQNWADAWAIGFTPYVTSVFWFGFDRPGQSLGLSITGASLAAPAWGDFMHIANEGRPYKPFFNKMPKGVVRATVCSKYGGLYTKECGADKIVGFFLSGTEPTEPCTKHSNTNPLDIGSERLREAAELAGWAFYNDADAPLSTDLDFLEEEVNIQSEENSWFQDLFGGQKKKSKKKDGNDSNSSSQENSGQQDNAVPANIPSADDETNWLLQ